MHRLELSSETTGSVELFSFSRFLQFVCDMYTIRVKLNLRCLEFSSVIFRFVEQLLWLEVREYRHRLSGMFSIGSWLNTWRSTRTPLIVRFSCVTMMFSAVIPSVCPEKKNREIQIGDLSRNAMWGNVWRKLHVAFATHAHTRMPSHIGWPHTSSNPCVLCDTYPCVGLRGPE
jgi:hypothetical protein